MSDSNWFKSSGHGQRVIYICDWLPPDYGAVGQYATQAAKELAAQGHDVLLVGLTSQASSIECESSHPGRLTVWRLRARSYNKTRLINRLIWTMRVNLMLLFRLLRSFTNTSQVYFTGSPPFMVHWVVPLCKILGKKSTYRITDFYPECIMVERQRSSLPLWLLHKLTVFWRKRVNVLEVLSEDQRKRLHEIGIPDSKIELRRDSSPISIPDDTEPLELPESIRGFVVLLYSGNFGVAHDYETFLRGYIRHHREGSGRVALWLNAVGSAAAIVESRLREARVPFHRSSPVPLEQLPNLLVTPHAHLITLKDAFVGYVLPSKVYGCIEAKRTVLYIGSEESDVHLLCKQSLEESMYHRVSAGNSEAVLHALNEIGQKLTNLTHLSARSTVGK